MLTGQEYALLLLGPRSSAPQLSVIPDPGKPPLLTSENTAVMSTTPTETHVSPHAHTTKNKACKKKRAQAQNYWLPAQSTPASGKAAPDDPLNLLGPSPRVLGFPGSWKLWWVLKRGRCLAPRSRGVGSFNPSATTRDLATGPQITIIRSEEPGQDLEVLHPH